MAVAKELTDTTVMVNSLLEAQIVTIDLLYVWIQQTGMYKLLPV